MRVLLMMAVLPAAVLLFYVYRLDPVEKEPSGLLLRLLLCGMASTVLAVIFEEIGMSVFLGGNEAWDLESLLFENFIVVALVEESCKFLFLYRQTWRNPNFNFAFDGIVYAVFVGLGFAIAENISYVFSYGPSVAVTRAFTAIPGHCMFAVFMGYFYGCARDAKGRGRGGVAAFDLVLAVFVPVLMHGTYDSLASIGSDEAIWGFLGFLVLMVVVGIQLMKSVSRDAERISR